MDLLPNQTMESSYRKQTPLEEEQQRNIKLSKELEARQKLNREKQRREHLQNLIRREKYRPLVEVGRAGAPLLKQAAGEIKSGVKEVAKAGAQATTSYIRTVASTPWPARVPTRVLYTLTPEGVEEIDKYNQGEVSLIPYDSMRAELMRVAKTRGGFTSGTALDMFGEDGLIAARLLGEHGLIKRS
jgi:hypothetical protein